MLEFLRIANFAVIADIQLEFRPGLNILTGETGSGKSIIIEALGLLAGNRSSTGHIRTGERVAIVEGNFCLNEGTRSKVQRILMEAGANELRGARLNIRREVNLTGRSRIFVDDELVTSATLQALQVPLIEIFGQGEQRMLLSRSFQVSLLDSFAGCLPLKKKVRENFLRRQKAVAALEDFQSELNDARRTEDYLRYQLAEIENVAPHTGEDEHLLAEKQLLTHAEKIAELSLGAYTALYESDESILSNLAGVRRQLEDLSKYDGNFSSLLESLQASTSVLVDIAESLREYRERMIFSPQKLAEIERRLSEIERIKRKYNTDLQGVLQVQDEVAAKLAGIAFATEREDSLIEELKRAETEYRKSAQLLSKHRKKNAPLLAAHVTKKLREVALEQAHFFVTLETPPTVAATCETEAAADSDADFMNDFHKSFTADGFEQVEFLLAANPGESPKPLAKVASGGELSRLMLTLRSIFALDNREMSVQGESLVFDEIDAGIGGRAAESVGKRLKSLANGRQVLCVTHQPQIARFADHQYAVAKLIENGRTTTTVRELNYDERVQELARMIGGTKAEVATKEAARWLLESASTDPQKISAGKSPPIKRRR
ncbi:MAG: DNA repair protein RecN [Pyrinomonadaceae bacterium]